MRQDDERGMWVGTVVRADLAGAAPIEPRYLLPPFAPNRHPDVNQDLRYIGAGFLILTFVGMPG